VNPESAVTCTGFGGVVVIFFSARGRSAPSVCDIERTAASSATSPTIVTST
jgi:hypothetical protein